MHYNAIISVTPQIVDRFKKVNKNSYLITNYPVIGYRFNIKSVQVTKNTFCYAGTITPLRLIHIIIKAMEAIPDSTFLLAGEIDSKYLKKLMSLKCWQNVNYYGQISYQQVLSIYSQSKFGIIIEDYHPINYNNEGSLGITKLFEYMQSGLPIICSDFILHKRIVEAHNCGITVNPMDINQIIEAIKFLLGNPDQAKRMGDNGHKAVINSYNWTTQEKVLIDLYKKLIS